MAFHWLDNKCKIFIRPCTTLSVLTLSKDWHITWNVPASPILHISHPACLYPGYIVSSSHMTLSHGFYVIIPTHPSRLDSLIIYLQDRLGTWQMRNDHPTKLKVTPPCNWETSEHFLYPCKHKRAFSLFHWTFPKPKEVKSHRPFAKDIHPFPTTPTCVHPLLVCGKTLAF